MNSIAFLMGLIAGAFGMLALLSLLARRLRRGPGQNQKIRMAETVVVTAERQEQPE